VMIISPVLGWRVERIEKGRRAISGGLPGSKLRAFEMAPSAPVTGDLHWQAKGANQNCCSIKGTNKLLRGGHYSSRFNFRFPQCVCVGASER
jgi:hypothetical protein